MQHGVKRIPYFKSHHSEKGKNKKSPLFQTNRKAKDFLNSPHRYTGVNDVTKASRANHGNKVKNNPFSNRYIGDKNKIHYAFKKHLSFLNHHSEANIQQRQLATGTKAKKCACKPAQKDKTKPQKQLLFQTAPRDKCKKQGWI